MRWAVIEDASGCVVTGPGVALLVRVVGSTTWGIWQLECGCLLRIVRAGLA